MMNLVTLHSIPLNYVQSTNNIDCSDEHSNLIPVIDFSLLTSDDPRRRSIAVHDLSKACQDFGVFMVVNHGIQEGLMKAVIDGMDEFFNLPEEEKQEFAEMHGLDPIRYGTTRLYATKENSVHWRDYIKVFNVHPHINFPNKPQGYRDIVSVYSQKSREIAIELLGGISESLGLEESFLEKAMDLKSGVQTFKGNYYPPCPKPELAMGLAAHSDHGLLTLHIQNQVAGLQIEYQGKWINVNAHPNSLVALTGDHLQIFSNGKYKSVVHRAVVNDKATRLSVTAAHGPPFETIVSPASPLIKEDKNPAAYTSITYKNFLELQQGIKCGGEYGKGCLERIKIQG